MKHQISTDNPGSGYFIFFFVLLFIGCFVSGIISFMFDMSINEWPVMHQVYTSGHGGLLFLSIVGLWLLLLYLVRPMKIKREKYWRWAGNVALVIVFISSAFSLWASLFAYDEFRNYYNGTSAYNPFKKVVVISIVNLMLCGVIYLLKFTRRKI